MKATQEQLEYIEVSMNAGAHLIPDHMMPGIKRYIVRGIPAGDFLSRLLCNDFFGACARADDLNQRAMWNWANFLHNHVPAGTFGSEAKYKAHIAKGGFTGKPDADPAP